MIIQIWVKIPGMADAETILRCIMRQLRFAKKWDYKRFSSKKPKVYRRGKS